jgi:hypothetical protein
MAGVNLYFLELLGEKKCLVKECIVFSMHFSRNKSCEISNNIAKYPHVDYKEI